MYVLEVNIRTARGDHENALLRAGKAKNLWEREGAVGGLLSPRQVKDALEERLIMILMNSYDTIEATCPKIFAVPVTLPYPDPFRIED